MNLHPITGAAAAGNGGVGAWVEGVCLFPGPAGFPCWIGDRFGYQSAEGTIRSCLPDGSDDQLVDVGPGAPLLAAGGHWAAFDGQNTRTDWNLTLPGCAPLGMAPDGTLFVATYQSQQDIQVIPPGAMAPALRLPDARPLVNLGSSRGHLSALSLVQFVWIDQSLTLRSYGFPAAPAQVDESARFPTVLSIDGRVILLYTTQSGRMVAHPYDDARAVWLVGVGGFGFTGRVLEVPQIECRWATGLNNVGEVGAIARQAIDLAVTPAAPLPAPEPDDPEPIPVIGRDLWFGGFSFDPTTTFPGNCDFQVHGDGYIRALDGRIIAQYVSASPDGDVDALEAAIAAAKAKDPHTPVLAYWTAQAQKVRVPKGATILGVEAYQHVGEPSADFEARIGASAAKGRAWLISQGYTSNAANVTALQPIVFSCARVTRAVQTIEGWLTFSGSGRATGYQDHPEVHDAYAQAFAGVTGEPLIEQPPAAPMDPPHHDPNPAPPPAPSPTPPFFPRARAMQGAAMKVGIRLNGKVTGIDPTPVAGKAGDDQFPLYADRDQVSAWEEGELTKHDNGVDFDLRYLGANRQLSLTPAGPQTRAAGIVGAWETLQATEQPDGTKLLYRVENGALVGPVFEVEVIA